MSVMNQIYFEAKGEELLKRIGMTKSEFARQMGIRKQNVKALFKTKNLETIYKAADVMGVPFELLVGYVEEPDLSEIPPLMDEDNEDMAINDGVISEGDIPSGDSTEDRRKRQQIIMSFYNDWKQRNPESKRYNLDLKEDINIRFVSVKETAGHASLTYLSTLAVLQLDAILTNAIFVEKLPANHKKNNQRGFESMIRMSYHSPGIGMVRMLVGVKHSDKSKIQYCITAIDAGKTKQEAE